MTAHPQRVIRTGLFALALLSAPLALSGQSAAAAMSFDQWRTGFSLQLDDEMAELSCARRSEEVGVTPKELSTTASLLRRRNLSSGPTLPVSEPMSSSIGAILVSQGLPRSLIAVVSIESGFNPAALSPKGAAGLWQFMPATARQYGLVVNAMRDDRFDVAKSTFAAAQYLRQLRVQFGDWPLALAAYNAGPSRVAQGIRRANSSNFLTLRRNSSLPDETLAYVPKVFNLLRNGGADAGLEIPPSTNVFWQRQTRKTNLAHQYHEANLVFATTSPDTESPHSPK